MPAASSRLLTAVLSLQEGLLQNDGAAAADKAGTPILALKSAVRWTAHIFFIFIVIISGNSVRSRRYVKG
jgi:hypothetical protein